MKYRLTWKSRYPIRGDKHYIGSLPVDTEASRCDFSTFKDPDAWGRCEIQAYIDAAEAGDVPMNDSHLSHFILALGWKNAPKQIDFLSAVRVVDPSRRRLEIDDKIRRKIQGLLSLAASENENEAESAMLKAYALMQKHSIRREEIDEQEMSWGYIDPKGKKIAHWESLLYAHIADAGGCYLFEEHQTPRKHIADGAHAGVNRMHITGRERDVVNVLYLAKVYEREIQAATRAYKKKHGLTTKQANDYRLGVVVGVAKRLLANTDEFFSKYEDEIELGNLVHVDTRVTEAKSVMEVEGVLSRKRTVTEHFGEGEEDAGKITVHKATTEKEKPAQIGR